MGNDNRKDAFEKLGSVNPEEDNSSGSDRDLASEADPDYSPDAVLARIRDMRDNENPTVRIPGWLVVAVLIGIGVAVWFWYNGLGVPDIPLCVINTSSDAPMEIYLDGKSIGTATQMITEDPNLALMGVLKVGNHKLEARDGSGTVVTSENLVVDKNSNGFLWTPLPNPSVKFLIQTNDYGESGT